MIMWQSIFGKYRFLIFLLLFPVSSIYSNIIFVYLSAQLPAYIQVALEQARLFNPVTDIYLIANQQAINQSHEYLNKSQIIAIPAETLKASKYHHRFNQKSTLDSTARDGLWRKATERFFYIHELMALYDLQSVVHIESDNMLYVDIAEFKDTFTQYPGIGIVLDNDTRCIPSVVYIAHQKAMAHLVQYIAEQAPKGYNDMQILAAYRNTYSQEYVDTLPLIMPEYIAQYPLISTRNQKAAHNDAYTNNIDLFASIFDGAAIGQYLGGIDPRNGVSRPGFINETCIFNPSLLAFEWHHDIHGRNVPFAVCNGKSYRINNLHIHSKFLEQFHS